MRNKLTHIIFAIVWGAVFIEPLREIFSAASHNPTYSHILAVPFISAYFFYTDRKAIFRREVIGGGNSSVGTIIVISGLIVLGAGKYFGPGLSRNDQLSLMMLAAILTLCGYFLIAVKNISLKAALFPSTFLLLAVPIPDLVRESIIAFLVSGSTAVTEVMFRITRVPYFREGVTFQLPGIAIEIAKECSGIRSSIGMLITVLIASHMFLKRFFSKAFLVAMIIPLVLIKNGIRITTLSLLAVYVDKKYLTDSLLHKSGGIVFFAIALALMLPVLILLRRFDRDDDNEVRPGVTVLKRDRF